jgi:predicted lipid-binding transport protein (Tim44 family)
VEGAPFQEWSPLGYRRELFDSASVGVSKGVTMKAHQALALVALTLLLGGTAVGSASTQEPSAPPQQPAASQQPSSPQQPVESQQPAGSKDSKAEAEAARKAARARLARCKEHPEICRQQAPK